MKVDVERSHIVSSGKSFKPYKIDSLPVFT